ncbi:hypothetical protein MAUB1S_08762 [Mycolicibacterium aubagnense]
MRKSTRILILTVVIELLLLTGAVYMITQTASGAWKTFNQAEALDRIYTTMGAAMGGVGAAFLFLAVVLRIKGQ